MNAAVSILRTDTEPIFTAFDDRFVCTSLPRRGTSLDTTILPHTL